MIYGITVLLSFLFIKFFSIAKLKLLSDIPNERSMHSVPVKRSAGFIFFILFWMVLFICKDEFGYNDNDFYLILFSTLFFSLLGFIDDIVNLSSKLKLILEICFVFIIFIQFHKSFSIFSYHFLSENLISIFILTFYIVFISNLCNFMDGLDLYLSTTFLFFIINFFIFRSFFLDYYFVILLLLLFSMSGFFYYNSPNAKMFMGDAGSLPIGFLISISPLYYNSQGMDNELTCIILFIPVFLIDGIFTLIKRSIEKKHIFRAHREHLYQRVQIELMWGKWKTLIVFSILNFMPSFFYLIINEYNLSKNYLLLSIFLILSIYTRIFFLCNKGLSNKY